MNTTSNRLRANAPSLIAGDPRSCIFGNPLTRTMCLRDGCIVLNIETGAFLSLDYVGSAIWQTIIRLNGDNISRLVSDLTAHKLFPTVDKAAEVSRVFLASLHRKGLISSSAYLPGEPPFSVDAHAPTQTLSSFEGIKKKGHKHNSLRTVSSGFFRLMAMGRYLNRRDGYRKARELVLQSSFATDGGAPEQSAVASMLDGFATAVSIYPFPTLCLQRAAALGWFLNTRHIKAQVIIGCHPLPFQAHAWVQIGDRVLFDDVAYVARYQALDIWG